MMPPPRAAAAVQGVEEYDFAVLGGTFHSVHDGRPWQVCGATFHVPRRQHGADVPPPSRTG